MKKVLIFISIFLIIGILIFAIYKYNTRFGYVTRGSDISVPNYRGPLSAFRLNDEEVFFLGCNDMPDAPSYNGNTWNYNMPIKETPSEIYNIEKNTHKIVHLPNNILYPQEGILLNNNKLLLPHVSTSKIINNKNGEHLDKSSTYKSIALIDLKTNKIIQTYDKKISKIKKTNAIGLNLITNTLLNNGKVLIIDFENKIAEVYNPDKNNSYIINLPFEKDKINVVVPFKENQALIFGQTKDNYDNNDDTVILYDDTTKTFKEFGHTMRRTNPDVILLKDNKFLIIGGMIYTSNGGYDWDVREIEIFDGNTGTYEIINNLPYKMKYGYYGDRNSFAVSKINDKYIILTGGYQGSYQFFKILKKTLIIDIEEKQIIKGPNLVYRMSFHDMLKISDKKILIYGSRIGSDWDDTQVLVLNERIIK